MIAAGVALVGVLITQAVVAVLDWGRRKAESLTAMREVGIERAAEIRADAVDSEMAFNAALDRLRADEVAAETSAEIAVLDAQPSMDAIKPPHLTSETRAFGGPTVTAAQVHMRRSWHDYQEKRSDSGVARAAQEAVRKSAKHLAQALRARIDEAEEHPDDYREVVSAVDDAETRILMASTRGDLEGALGQLRIAQKRLRGTQHSHLVSEHRPPVVADEGETDAPV